MSVFYESFVLQFNTAAALQEFVQSVKLQAFATQASNVIKDQSHIGFVPTMGALHEGHLSLIRRARAETQCVIVSIFVNPLQFSATEDFDRYPQTLSADLEHCRTLGVDGVFVPSRQELLGDGLEKERKQELNFQKRTLVHPPSTMIHGLCGRSRPGHFEGVATIVLKLLNIVCPDRVYMGQKDAQQLAIIRRMVKDFNLNVQIVGCPIVRDRQGLALSSRNQYLSAAETQQALLLSQSLNLAKQAFHNGTRHRQPLIELVESHLSQGTQVRIDYVDLVNPETMMPLTICEDRGLLAIAANIGTTRLIDNMILEANNRDTDMTGEKKIDAKKIIVAIDGPAGAGKSTVTRRCAEKLGLLYLDTGAMYRAVTWWVLQSQVNLRDEPAIAALVNAMDLDLSLSNQPDGGMEVFVNGENITQVIRSQEVTAAVSAIAAQSAVRDAMVKRQQQFGRQGNVIAEGRDIGTHVFPDANLKIFLTASIEERANRRYLELSDKGETSISLEALKANIAERDAKDSNRQIAPLKKAEDAIVVMTDNLSIDQVCNKIVDLFHTTQ